MSNNNSLIASINVGITQINRHGALLMIIIGTVGNLLSICVLTERSFRYNPCSIYLWWSSFFSIAFIWSGLLTRVLGGYGISWPNQNSPLCKVRLFILTICWSMSTWSFVGASIDRYFSSSESITYRLWSTRRTARRFLIIILVLSVLLCGEIFYCYEGNVPNVPVACYSYNSACQLYNEWLNILYNIVIPSGFMAGFGILTLLNVRKRIINPTTSVVVVCGVHQPRKRKIDRHLRRLLLIQVSILLLLNLPIAVQRLYASMTSNLNKVALRVAVENLIYSIVVLISFLSYSMSFYLYILTGSKFRAAFKRMIYRKLCHTQLSRQCSRN